MKLQFNLLPDVKQEYLKTQRTKRAVIAASCVASAVALFILFFMLITVDVINKKQLSDADKNITKYSKQLKAIPDLNKILTVQNQLNSVVSLHQSKHITSRLYQYLPEITPTNVCLGKVTLDTGTNSLVLEGTTDTLKSINGYADTLKFTTYKVAGQNSEKPAFPTVVETQFGLSAAQSKSTCAGTAAPATYQLTLSFDPALFSNAATPTLAVPNETSSRSVLDDPSNPLFNGQTKDTTSQNSSTGGTQ